MLHEILFIVLYLAMLPTVLVSPVAGVLLYTWLDNLPPQEVYSVSLLPEKLAFVTGALTFFVWLAVEKKTIPRPLLLTGLLIALLIWVNVTWLHALAPAAGEFRWDETVKVLGFAILTALILSTRARLEAFLWVLVLSATYFAVPGAAKLLISGGSGGIGEGEVVVAATNSFFGDRVVLSVVLAMFLPFALYLGRRATLLPPRLLRWVWPGMLGLAAAFLLAVIGTFSRTGLLAGGATLLMLVGRSDKKFVAFLTAGAVALLLFAIAPENWFGRMDTIINYEQDTSAVSRIGAWKWAWAMALEHPIVGGGFGVFVLDRGMIPGVPGWMEAHNIFFQMMAEHGFVGLGLFCGLILVTYGNSAAIRKRVRNQEEFAWAGDLARAVQIGIVAFVVGGMFVSIASAPFLYSLTAITIGLRNLVEREVMNNVRNRAIGPIPVMAHPAE